MLGKIEPWLRGLLVAGLVLTAVHGGWQTAGLIRAREPQPAPDIATRQLQRWAPTREWLQQQLPPGAALGYLQVASPTQTPSSDASTAQYFAAQWALLPWRLEKDLDQPLSWTVVDFMGSPLSGWNPPSGWSLHSAPTQSTLILRRVRRPSVP